MPTRLLTLFSLLVLLAGCGPIPVAEGLKRAQADLDAGKAPQAIKRLEDMAKAHPQDSSVLEALAFAHLNSGDPARAGELFTSLGLTKDPDDHLYAAQAFKKANQNGKAIDAYRLYLLEEPKQSGPWSDLGDLLVAENETPDAIAAYVKAQELAPSPELAMKIGSLYDQNGNAMQAQRYLQNSLKLSRAKRTVGTPAAAIEGDALAHLADLALRERRPMEASRHITQLERDFPQHPQLSDLRAKFASDVANTKTGDKKKESWIILTRQKSADGTPSTNSSSQPAASQNSAVINKSPAPNTTNVTKHSSKNKKTALVSMGSENSRASNSFNLANEIPAEEIMAAGEAATKTSSPTSTVRKSNTSAVLTASGSSARVSQDFIPSTSDISPSAPATVPSPSTRTVTPSEADVAQSKAVIQAADNLELVPVSAKDPLVDALSVDGKNPARWVALAAAKAKAGDYAWAETAYLEAMRLKPHDASIILAYLEVVALRRTPAEYLNEAERQLAKYPEIPELYTVTARGYRDRLKNNRNASILFKLFLEKFPNNPEAAQVKVELAGLR